MADIDEEDRYGLFGLVIGLQNRDLSLVTENLLKVCHSKAFLRLWYMVSLEMLLTVFSRFVAGLFERYNAARRAHPTFTGSLSEFDRRIRKGIGRELFAPTG